MKTIMINKIPKENYYDNQLLNVDDFQRERDFHILHRELQTAIIIDSGIFYGLDITLSEKTKLNLGKGLAIDNSGKQILLSDSLSYDSGTVVLTGDGFVIDLDKSQYYNKEFNISIKYSEKGDSTSQNIIDEIPVLTIEETLSDDGSVLLGTVKVDNTTSQDEQGKTISTTTVTITGNGKKALISKDLIGEISADSIDGEISQENIPNINAAKITEGTLIETVVPDIPSTKITGALTVDQIPELPVDKLGTGEFSADRIPSLDASKITSGVLSDTVLPNVPSTKISGLLSIDQIPNIPLNKLESGEFSVDRIPNLNASKISSGLLSDAVIPDIDSAKISTGVLNIDRIPEIPASKVKGISGGDFIQVWKEGIALVLRGMSILNGESSDYILGVLKTETALGKTYYGLGIGFKKKLFSFYSNKMENSNLKLNIYSNCEDYSLERETGDTTDTVRSVNFVGVNNKYESNLLDSGNPIVSFVSFGTKLSSSSGTIIGAMEIINGIRDQISPFSFMSFVANQDFVDPVIENMAKKLSDQGYSVADAAPILMATKPSYLMNSLSVFLKILMTYFPKQMSEYSVLAWAFSASGVSNKDAAKVLAVRIPRTEFIPAFLGAYPSPEIMEIIVEGQNSAEDILSIAKKIIQANPMYKMFPMAMGVIMKMRFYTDVLDLQSMEKLFQSLSYSDSNKIKQAINQIYPVK